MIYQIALTDTPNVLVEPDTRYPTIEAAEAQFGRLAEESLKLQGNLVVVELQ
jgi:hypothetical protein